MFGGTSNSAKKDTWVFDYDEMNWIEYDTEEEPSRRAWYAMAYDPISDAVILHGGGKNRHVFDDQLWFFNPATLGWADMTPAE